MYWLSPEWAITHDRDNSVNMTLNLVHSLGNVMFSRRAPRQNQHDKRARQGKDTPFLVAGKQSRVTVQSGKGQTGAIYYTKVMPQSPNQTHPEVCSTSPLRWISKPIRLILHSPHHREI